MGNDRIPANESLERNIEELPLRMLLEQLSDT